jgi:hypothetical protein
VLMLARLKASQAVTQIVIASINTTRITTK